MKRLIPWLALGAAVAGLGACKPETSLLPAPAWSLTDVDGRTVTSDQFKGKVVVIDFWATWCSPCIEETPGYVKLQKKYAADGLVIIGVSGDHGTDEVKKFIKRYGVDYPIVMCDDKIQDAFGGIDAYPTTFIVDRDGMIRDRHKGFLAPAEFERQLTPYLNSDGGGN